jgi:hypothetical protein
MRRRGSIGRLKTSTGLAPNSGAFSVYLPALLWQQFGRVKIHYKVAMIPHPFLW